MLCAPTTSSLKLRKSSASVADMRTAKVSPGSTKKVRSESMGMDWPSFAEYQRSWGRRTVLRALIPIS